MKSSGLIESLTLYPAGAERWNIRRQSVPSFGTNPNPEQRKLGKGAIRPIEISFSNVLSIMSGWRKRLGVREETRGPVYPMWKPERRELVR